MRAYGLGRSELNGNRGRGHKRVISGGVLGRINDQSSVVQLLDTISYGGSNVSARSCISVIAADELCE